MIEEITKAEENTTPKITYPALFYMGLKELIQTKSVALFELRKLENDLNDAERKLSHKESKLILTTDFKELGLTNEKMRKSYIYDELYDDKCDIAVMKGDVEEKRDTIEIINHLIRLSEIKLQGAL
ncbi:MAG: hypothetical protein IJH12_01905 [Clostridia bacterium]|nr:hypothetical protein [Clostridia bacterium]